jgi:hypothetical protein
MVSTSARVALAGFDPRTRPDGAGRGVFGLIAENSNAIKHADVVGQMGSVLIRHARRGDDDRRAGCELSRFLPADFSTGKSKI